MNESSENNKKGSAESEIQNERVEKAKCNKNGGLTDLDVEEQKLRIQELRCKVMVLQKSDWRKLTTWTGMIAILVAIMGIIGQGILYEIKSEKAKRELDVVLANKKSAEDSIGLLKKSATQDYEATQSLITNAKHQLDSLKSLIAGSPGTSSNQIKSLLKQATQTLNTEIQSSPVYKLNDTAITKAPVQSVDYPDDPQKGKWGGLAERNGRKISATVQALKNGYFKVVIKVNSTSVSNPLTGKVIFHLHNSFRNQNPEVEAENNEASLVLNVYGSFTVGAETDNGNTKLELDLAELPGVTKRFRDN